jgi:hypothetical protein
MVGREAGSSKTVRVCNAGAPRNSFSVIGLPDWQALSGQIGRH